MLIPFNRLYLREGTDGRHESAITLGGRESPGSHTVIKGNPKCCNKPEDEQWLKHDRSLFLTPVNSSGAPEWEMALLKWRFRDLGSSCLMVPPFTTPVPELAACLHQTEMCLEECVRLV